MQLDTLFFKNRMIMVKKVTEDTPIQVALMSELKGRPYVYLRYVSTHSPRTDENAKAQRLRMIS